jgi:hypothetical protein
MATSFFAVGGFAGLWQVLVYEHPFMDVPQDKRVGGSRTRGTHLRVFFSVIHPEPGRELEPLIEFVGVQPGKVLVCPDQRIQCGPWLDVVFGKLLFQGRPVRC